MAKGVILLAAGGTGGHLFPAEALAHELKRRGWDVHLATDDRAGRFAGSFPADTVHPIASATLGSNNPAVLLKTFFRLWRGVRQAGKLIAELRPRAVVGFGGYPTVPPLFAATRRGVPTLIHEQNAVMGRANKALAQRVDAIAGGFLSETASRVPEKTIVTGNPVRPAVIEAAKTTYRAPGEQEPFRLLVFGGSQGARFFSEAVPPALAALPEHERKRLQVMQQARAEDESKVRGAYAEMGISAEIAPFFNDLAARMAAVHLVISRSGASTVSEIAVIGRPALLVPYPYALDHDQAANAAALAAAGGAEVYPQAELTTERLSGLICDLMKDRTRLERMAAAARSAGKSDATSLLADLAEAIAGGRNAVEYKKDTSA